MVRVRMTAANITNRKQLSAWVQGPLHALIPHQKAILGFGQVRIPVIVNTHSGLIVNTIPD